MITAAVRENGVCGKRLIGISSNPPAAAAKRDTAQREINNPAQEKTKWLIDITSGQRTTNRHLLNPTGGSSKATNNDSKQPLCFIDALV